MRLSLCAQRVMAVLTVALTRYVLPVNVISTRMESVQTSALSAVVALTAAAVRRALPVACVLSVTAHAAGTVRVAVGAVAHAAVNFSMRLCKTLAHARLSLADCATIGIAAHSMCTLWVRLGIAFLPSIRTKGAGEWYKLRRNRILLLSQDLSG